MTNKNQRTYGDSIKENVEEWKGYEHSKPLKEGFTIQRAFEAELKMKMFVLEQSLKTIAYLKRERADVR